MAQVHGGLVVVIPTYNEKEGIGPTLEEVRKVLGDVPCIVVDRSTDGTARVAEEHGAKVLRQRDRGKGRAIARALREGTNEAHFLALIDGDYTYPAEAIRNFVRILEEDPGVGMVTGNRFNDSLGPRAPASIFYVGNRAIALAHNLMNGQKMNDPLTGLRVLRVEVFRDWRPQAKGFDIEVEMNHHVTLKSYRIAEVPIQYRPRLGRKKLRLRDGFLILARVLRHRF